jgi:hypothetical protein
VADLQQLFKESTVKPLQRLDLVWVQLHSETVHLNANSNFSKVSKHRKFAQLETNIDLNLREDSLVPSTSGQGFEVSRANPSLSEDINSWRNALRELAKPSNFS